MNIQVRESNGKKYIEGLPGYKLIETETDVIDLIGCCGENYSQHILLYPENLSEGFFDLKTLEAGYMLQKFVTYCIRAALVLPLEFELTGRFREMALEANRGQHFRVFHERNQAVDWLLKG